MELNIFYYLAIILFVAKTFGLLARKIGLPQVAGMVIGGLILGLLSNFHSDSNVFLSFIIKPNLEEKEVLNVFSQIGVVLILFSSGLETNIKDIKKCGLASTIIAFFGVIIPLILGTLGTMLYLNGFSDFSKEKLFNCLFTGIILTATSVGITVETLKELGKLNTKIGQTLVSAAIIDDVMGIIALSILTSVSGGGLSEIWITLLKAVGFFVFAIGVGLLLRIFFNWEEHHYPHKRRTGIYAFAVCFLFAFVAERFFDIASITGAYMAGIMLSGLEDTNFVDRKVTVSGYMIFTPIFFTYIGLSADFSSFNLNYLLFALLFIVLAIIGKVVGCGGIAKLFKFNFKESMIIGSGMMARGEVALAVYSTASYLIMPTGGVDPLVATIILIVISSILCPIILKLLFKGHTEEQPQLLNEQAQ